MPPLVVADEEIDEALDLMDRTAGELARAA